MYNLLLSAFHQKSLIDHSLQKSPFESCALLFGSYQHHVYSITDILLTNNFEKSPIKFSISSDELLSGYKLAESNNTDIIGIFHSHTISEPYPSIIDKKFMKINPVVWLIFSNFTMKFKSYLLKSQIIEIPITTI